MFWLIGAKDAVGSTGDRVAPIERAATLTTRRVEPKEAIQP
jgi:hypothetical protein